MQLNNVFKEWLNSRKISDQVLEDFGIYGEDSIVIPVYDIQGIFLFNKYRKSPLAEEGDKYWFDTGSKVTLFAAKKAQNSQTILITEGELDCLVAWSHNIPAVTSTNGALSFQSEWVNYFNGKNVILCFDNDATGGDGMVKVLEILPDAKVVFIPDRPNMKDITDYVASGGDLHTLLRSAKHFADISAVKEDMLNRMATFQSVHFHKAYIKKHTKVVPKNVQRKAFDNDKLTNAKLYPIENLISFNSKGKACCPFHNEKTPSFHYFPKNNSAFCFGGCYRPYDSINIYQQLHGCSFKEAVDELNKLL